MLGLEGGGGAALRSMLSVWYSVHSAEVEHHHALSLLSLPLSSLPVVHLPYLFISSALFRFSSLLVGSPRFSAMTGPGLAWWCSALAFSCSGWSEAAESRDSLATLSVRSGRENELDGWCEGEEMGRGGHTGARFFFLREDGHGCGCGCGGRGWSCNS